MTSEKHDPDELSGLFREAKNTTDELHRKYTEGANLTGYIRDRLEANEPYWVSLADYSRRDSEYDETVTSGIQFMRSYAQQLSELHDQFSDQSTKLVSLASSGATFDANGTCQQK